jgi:hypothetical protein
MGHPPPARLGSEGLEKTNGNSKVNSPTQAKRGLVWATRYVFSGI